MTDKTCGECKHCTDKKVIATCKHVGITTEDVPGSDCKWFEPKVITNGDELANDKEYTAAVIVAAHGKTCPFCAYYVNKKCTASGDKNCLHGVVAWLNAPAEREETE